MCVLFIYLYLYNFYIHVEGVQYDSKERLVLQRRYGAGHLHFLERGWVLPLEVEDPCQSAREEAFVILWSIRFGYARKSALK